MTAALLEEHEDAAFAAKLARRREVLGDLVLEGEDDDGDFMVQLVLRLREARQPLTTSEVTRALQHENLLSAEFPAAAKMQATAMLTRLHDAGAVVQDEHGRWRLV